MSNIFVQDSGHMYLIPNKETLINIYDNETFDLYRVDNRSEGMVETPDDLKELIEADNNDVGFEIGHILDIDLETLEEAVYVKKYGLTTEQLSEKLNRNIKYPYEDGESTVDGYKYSYSVDRWFYSFIDSEEKVMLDKILERNNTY